MGDSSSSIIHAIIFRGICFMFRKSERMRNGIKIWTFFLKQQFALRESQKARNIESSQLLGQCMVHGSQSPSPYYY